MQVALSLVSGTSPDEDSVCKGEFLVYFTSDCRRAPRGYEKIVFMKGSTFS